MLSIPNFESWGRSTVLIVSTDVSTSSFVIPFKVILKFCFENGAKYNSDSK